MIRAPIAIACVAFILTSGAAAGAHAPKCFGRDYSGDLKCFLTQFPGNACYDSYFGFSGDPDYVAALKCFESHKTWPFVAMMYLNGQGAPRDAQKAAQWAALGKQMPDKSTDGEQRALEHFIQKARTTPDKEWDPILMCWDLLEQTAYENEYCTSIAELVNERKAAVKISAIRARLGGPDASLLDRLVEAFGAYQQADSKRTEKAWEEGTIRALASMAQAARLRDDFIRLADSTLQERTLKATDEIAYRSADDALNHAYRADLEQNQKTEYRKLARTAELAWIRYRDAWAESAASLYSAHADDFDPALSVKTAVTKMRVEELHKSEQP